MNYSSTPKFIFRLFHFLLFVLIAHFSHAQTYLIEDFEGSWSGVPAAPAGWTQSRMIVSGSSTPSAISTNGPKDWEQNTCTGTSLWEKAPATPGVVPSKAKSGTKVLWMNNRWF